MLLLVTEPLDGLLNEYVRVSPSTSVALNAVAELAVSSFVLKVEDVVRTGASFTELIVTATACEVVFVPSLTLTLKLSEPLAFAFGV